MDQKFFHSVRLDKEKCKGCTNCLKRCPTEAIRVRGGRAHIINERCIDCGECIRVCDYHAKYAQTDPLASINRFKYKIALPAPSLYGQFKHLISASQVLEGLLKMGFDDVFEVAEGADIVTRAIRERMRGMGRDRYPVISSACPAIVRRLPGYDCGSCGSPTCRTFAEDIVRGYCNEMDCIHILKEQLKVMAQKMVELAKTTRE